MKRILVTGAANIGKAGVATIVYKWGQELDSTRFVYDYLMQSGLPEKKYQKAIQSKGSIMYTLPPRKRTPITIIRWIKKIVSCKKYETIHINSDSAYIAAAYIYAAKKGGVKTILVHSHCTQIDENNLIKRILKTLLHQLCMPYVTKNATICLACSTPAGQWMFCPKYLRRKKIQVIYNGIDVKNYLFQPSVREKVRNDLHIGSSLAICHIGRFSYQKNHRFLIRLFYEYHKINKNSKLFLIGKGDLEESVKKLVTKKGLVDCVFFLGSRKDVPQLLSGMDLMLMPSRFEGLPVTLVEAQMADLPCLAASTITKEARFTSSVAYVNSWNKKSWIRGIEAMKDFPRNQDISNKLSSKFNIQYTAAQLMELFEGS